MSPKSIPRDYLKAKQLSDAGRAGKKPILGGWVRHRARQEDPKKDLQTDPRAPKNEDLHLIPKGIGLEASGGATDGAFGRKNGGFLSTWREMHTVMSASPIFRGCTVRFACFCNGSCLEFATKNSPRQHFFT